MRWKLDRVAAIVSGGQADALTYPWHELTPAHVAAVASALVRDGARADGGAYSARTVNATLAALRGVLREAWRSGLINHEALSRLSDVKPEPVPTETAGRHVTAGEVGALFDATAADSVPERGARDAALLSLLYGGGLRAAEACSLRLRDFDSEAESVHVQGKGRKLRHVPLASGAGGAVAAWLELAGNTTDDDPLLRSVNKGGSIGDRMSPRGVGRACDRLGLEAPRARVLSP